MGRLFGGKSRTGNRWLNRHIMQRMTHTSFEFITTFT